MIVSGNGPLPSAHTYSGDSCPACAALDGCERRLRHVLILDTETTGLDETSACIEIACAVYSVEHAAVVESFASLIRHDGNAAESVNRIPASLVALAPLAEDVWPQVYRLATVADAVVAHGADFDRRFMPARSVAAPWICPAPWICSRLDLDWPRAERPGQSLVTLALAHGLGVSHAHRAAVDVDLIARLLTRVRELGVPLVPFLARGLRPRAAFQALVSYDDRALAKDAGFQWDGSARTWTRAMAYEDAAALPFRVREV